MFGDCRLIPVAILRERYAYDPETGIITYRTGHSKMLGRQVGWINHDGYRVLKVSHGGRRLQITAHCLAWALHHGEHPTTDVDHEDTDRQNNRIRNLRLSTRSQNLANRRTIQRDLPRGVVKAKSGRFQAQIGHEGRVIYLGLYDCPVEAGAVYAARAKELFGEFARVA